METYTHKDKRGRIVLHCPVVLKVKKEKHDVALRMSRCDPIQGYSIKGEEREVGQKGC